MSSSWLAVRASTLISGATAVVHGCSFMHWAYQKGGVAGCNAGWESVMCGELTSSSTFTALLIGASVETLQYKHSASIQSLSITPETG